MTTFLLLLVLLGPTRSHGHKHMPGQRQIAPDRVRQIQIALQHVGYYQGPVNGHWDPATELSMRHFQADYGWQTVLVPDARALIKLGLGPDHDS